MAKKKFFDKKEEVKENKEVEEKEVNVEEVKDELKDEVKDEVKEEVKNGKLANCELLNARKEPSKDSEVLFVVSKEDKIVILGEENDFYKVSVNNKEAYCMKNFIAVE